MILKTEKQRIKENVQTELRAILAEKPSPKSGEKVTKLMLLMAAHGFSIEEACEIVEQILLEVRKIDTSKMAIVDPDGRIVYQGKNFKVS